MNGGAGLCNSVCFFFFLRNSHEKDKDFIIVCEGGMDFYKGHPVLHELVRSIGTKKSLGIILKIEIVLHLNLIEFGNTTPKM